MSSKLNDIRAIVFLTLVITLEVKTIMLKKGYDAVCEKVIRKPFFREEMVLNKKWAAYYVWGQISRNINNACIKVTFKRAHPLLIDSVMSTMRPYLDTTLDLSAATLYMKLSPGLNRHLLIPMPGGVPGQYYELFHISAHYGKHYKLWRKAVQENKVTFKLFRDGRYLAFSDCSFGMTMLLYSEDENSPRPDPKEMMEVISYLDLEHGTPTFYCT